MPMYEFQCNNCGHKAEKIVPMDTKHIQCSSCGSEAIKIVALPSPPKFNGSGWTRKFHKMGK